MTLKEQLHAKDAELANLMQEYASLAQRQVDTNQHLAGIRNNETQERKAPISIRPRVGIQDRIARAEAKDRQEAAPLVEQRKKEFEERIHALERETLKPETEIVGEVTEEGVKEDAVG